MNRLQTEPSPYLRQHAGNPVDWYPWGHEAFALARGRNVPILLSVGYASCHWCHVMAHEAFSDPETAQLMNEGFVNIKVDREQRPDIDALYMEAMTSITGSGGWPMNVFLTPDAKPFYGGTYFPLERRGGLPAFKQVLDAVSSAWQQKRDEVETQAASVVEAIKARTRTVPAPFNVISDVPLWLDSARNALLNSYDQEWGGFGGAPKFPQPGSLALLLAFAENHEAQGAVLNTLDAMISGGIYDHIGGGFHRYSVDAFWMVPHFEKMLYDQAGMIDVLRVAFERTGAQHYRQVVEETVDYVLTTLSAPRGGWYSAQDADSEGEEGRFYVWKQSEISMLLAEPLASVAIDWYGVTSSGNFEGSNILHRPVRGDVIRSAQVEDARARLRQARLARLAPAVDAKVVTETTAMFAKALAECAVTFERDDWLAQAIQACEFIDRELRTQSGRLARMWTPEASASQDGFVSDYACAVDAFATIAVAGGDSRWASEAIELADEMVELFADVETGGFFTAASDTSDLIVRCKDLYDSATPASNSQAASALVTLLTGGLVTGSAAKDRYQRLASGALETVALVAENHPTAFPNLLMTIGRLAVAQ